MLEGFFDQLARCAVRAHVERELWALCERDPTQREAAAAAFRELFARAYRSLFWAGIVPIEDPGASGDAIIERCAAMLPPGVRISLVGMQNIKGTGLDFVYRWVAVDHVVSALEQLASDRQEDRLAALDRLDSFVDYGVVDAGLAVAVLARDPAGTIEPDEAARRGAVRARLEETREQKRAALQRAGARSGPLARVASWIEGWIDYLDSARRYRKSRQLRRDLVAGRISYGSAQLEMRALVARQKGGWLSKRLMKSAGS